MEDTCRICFSSDGDTQPFIQWNTLLCSDVTYEDVFYHCTQLERVDFEELNKICATCESDLQTIYKFIKKAEASFLRINKDAIVGKFEVEFLETELIDDDLLSEANDCGQMQSEDVLDKLDETNNVDEFCKEELFLETIEDPFERRFVLDNSEPKNDIDENGDNICQFCGKCLSNKVTKARHIDLMHDVSSNVLCDKCPKTFKSKFALAKHRKIHQKDRERKYSCKFCNQKFFTSSTCRSHEETHVDKREKKHKCDQCEKAFYQTGALNVHKRMHTGQMVHCLICAKRYPRLVDLKIHMRIHTNDRPFECELCKGTFISSSALGLHIKKDHLGFKFNCNICSKRFKAPELLKQHKAVHNTFPFACGLCSVTFVKRFLLHRHLKRVHNITEEADLKQHVTLAEQKS